MNDDELKQRLNQLRVPPPADGARELAWHRTGLAFRNGPREPAPAEARWGLRTFAVAMAVCVVTAAAFMLGRWSNDPAPSAELRLLTEMQRLFPNQLQAVIFLDGRTEILTSEEATTFSGQPVLVALRDREHEVRIVSFSGQRITTKLDGRNVVLEFLVTPEGALIVAGDSFLWRSDRPEIVHGFQLEAHQLTAGL